MTPSLSETFEPPRTTVYGRSGDSVSRSSTSSSAAISRPAALGRSSSSSETLACLRCTTPKPSETTASAKFGELARECRALGLVLRGLPRVEPQVLEHEDLAVAECLDLGRGIRPDRVGREGDGCVDQLAEPRRDGRQAVLGIGCAVGAAEVGDHDDAGALADEGRRGWVPMPARGRRP